MFVEQQLLGAQNDFDCLITTTKYALKNDCRNLIDSTTINRQEKVVKILENVKMMIRKVIERKSKIIFIIFVCVLCVEL